jgi:putative SOS response-associated peptidase YedK
LTRFEQKRINTMCGRYSFAPKPKQLDTQMRDVQRPVELHISYNIAPTHQAYVIANDAPGTLQTMEWGLVPYWSADGKNTGRLINARAEGIEEKPSFREPLRSRRCLVPADSFYEWRTEPGGRKTPYRILPENDDLLFMAGIWDEWRHGDAHKRTFSIITHPAQPRIGDPARPDAGIAHQRRCAKSLALTPADRRTVAPAAPRRRRLAQAVPGVGKN